MFNLFSRKQQLLDEDSILWIFDSFAWAMEQFDNKVFAEETSLVLPNNQFFPGEENSAEGMANLIFSQVKTYAGMSHWPTRLVNLAEAQPPAAPQAKIQISGQLRGKQASAHFACDLRSVLSVNYAVDPQALDNRIAFYYHPQQLKSPESLIAHFAQGVAHQVVMANGSVPPGGKDYLPVAIDLVGIFMGFGIIFANSAVVARSGGCGGCGGGQSPMREVILSENEAVYALALFCQLKSVDAHQVTRHLKKHLRAFFKVAFKDCASRLENKSYPALSVN